MSLVNCQLEIPDVQGLEAGVITVGRHLVFNCKGETESTFDYSKAQFKTSEPLDYKLFKTESLKGDGLKIEFAIYKTGDVKISDLILTDGATEINLNSSDIKVTSVLQPSKDGKPQQPYGPLFPLSLTVPGAYYLVLIGSVLTVSLYLFLKARRLSFYRKLKAKLNQFDSPIDPDTQFYKSIRMAEKNNYPLVEVEKSFRLYNVRTFKIPLFDLENDRAIRYFKHNDPAQKTARLQLEKLLSDFEELNKQANLKIEEKNEFISKLYRYVDQHKGRLK